MEQRLGERAVTGLQSAKKSPASNGGFFHSQLTASLGKRHRTLLALFTDSAVLIRQSK
jgi:hypothetical protein